MKNNIPGEDSQIPAPQIPTVPDNDQEHLAYCFQLPETIRAILLQSQFAEDPTLSPEQKIIHQRISIFEKGMSEFIANLNDTEDESDHSFLSEIKQMAPLIQWTTMKSDSYEKYDIKSQKHPSACFCMIPPGHPALERFQELFMISKEGIIYIKPEIISEQQAAMTAIFAITQAILLTKSIVIPEEGSNHYYQYCIIGYWQEYLALKQQNPSLPKFLERILRKHEIRDYRDILYNPTDRQIKENEQQFVKSFFKQPRRTKYETQFFTGRLRMFLGFTLAKRKTTNWDDFLKESVKFSQITE